jgi:copper chaperone
MSISTVRITSKPIDGTALDSAAQEAGGCGCAAAEAPVADGFAAEAGAGSVAASTTTTYTVAGMTCGHCVNAVTEELSALDGVSAVSVDLAAGRATVTSGHRLAEAQVRAAVAEAGYELV